MTEISIFLDPAVICFYSKVAQVAGLSLENVLSDTLFKLAGELSLESFRANTLYFPENSCNTATDLL